MTLTINLSPDLESRLRAASTADGMAPEEIVVGALTDRFKGAAPPNASSRLSSEESKLLTSINEGLTADEWQRYHKLQADRQAETLTLEEQGELVAFSDRLEALNVSRLENPSALARLRGITLEQIMAQLGIRRPDNG